MFGFFRSESRASSSTTVLAPLVSREQAPSGSSSLVAPRPAANKPCRKRGAPWCDGPADEPTPTLSAKRLKSESQGHDAAVTSHASPALCTDVNMDRARDCISHHFGLEVLTKHNELRLINQELAKCQVALEQLRRCHLIPYPQTCPTPDQMLNISSGTGPALAAKPNQTVAPWAPPFGVVDGPYARHYAKWLIPDASFDGLEAAWQPVFEGTRPRGSLSDARTTRNSLQEPGASGKARLVRGLPGQKLQALASGYPQPKDKAGPCILKRSDGKTVKLVCIDCHRENFSSTQGFINHCRIAHKRDFKSHEEAAVQSGQIIDVSEPPSVAVEPKPPAAPPSSARVHPLARCDMSDQQAYMALCSRIDESLGLYYAGKLPGVDNIPTSSSAPKAAAAALPTAQGRAHAPLDGASQTPYLSRLLGTRDFGGCLGSLVADAKTKVSLEDLMPEEESDDDGVASDGVSDASTVRPPVIMRVPARSAKPSVPLAASSRPLMSKAPSMQQTSMLPNTRLVMSKHASVSALSEEDMELDDAKMSPSTSISNNAPSLVSDDGEYDDSDEGSSVSGVSEHHIEDASMSDVAEISLDDEHDGRGLRRPSGAVAAAVKLRKEDSKHVTFVSTIKNSTRQGRLRRARVGPAERREMS
ncbi:hypothetical protein CDD81_5258 [Ophiocordyceps australis]|uniref:AHC1-like C2H2 zinc-finger domain-containing protein n=1 Tax=Ophiocordyceps australis TaxID=1399860 RepID=A0A2C5YGS2_9HYPO|nr:hypothetical protein CDD81_5258 [Ophiocordyceps australis]